MKIIPSYNFILAFLDYVEKNWTKTKTENESRYRSKNIPVYWIPVIMIDEIREIEPIHINYNSDMNRVQGKTMIEMVHPGYSWSWYITIAELTEFKIKRFLNSKL